MASQHYPATRLLLWLLTMCALWAFGCGDDDAADAAADASVMDSGFGPPPAQIRRKDAAVTLSDPVPQCDRADPLGCGPGQKCHPVVRRAAGEDTFTLYPGCVDDRGGRELGAPCDPWGGGSVPYVTDGLDDELYVDPCDENLYCAPDPTIRNAYTCQRACISGIGCPSGDQLCVGPNEVEAVCREVDHCDPLTGGGCPAGQSCYVELDGNGVRALTICQSTPDAPLADGEPCLYVDDCEPGSSCWGPPRQPPERWTQETLVCRRSCGTLGDMADLDAGILEEDAGAGNVTGGCGGDQVCQGLAVSGLDVSLLGDGFGQCE